MAAITAGRAHILFSPRIRTMTTLSTTTTQSTKTVPLGICVAADEGNAIGANGSVPWPRLAADIAHMRTCTTQCDDANKVNAVIMGRKTYESIPKKMRPLKGRLNIVLTSGAAASGGGGSGGSGSIAKHAVDEPLYVSSFSAAMEAVDARSEWIERAWGFGGTSVYADTMNSPRCDLLYLTRVFHRFEGTDTFMPDIDPHVYEVDTQWQPMFAIHEGPMITVNVSANDDVANGVEPSAKRAKVSENAENATVAAPAAATKSTASVPLRYQLLRYKRRKEATHEEYAYLSLIREIIQGGVQRGDRTGTGTLSVFGRTMRFSLRDGVIPLLTTKRVFWRGVMEELLWFVKGSTNAQLLADRKVHIWDGNGSRAFLDSRGLSHYAENDLGPVYGFQWRHWGAAYESRDADYTNKGVDQLKAVIERIRSNPTDRRIIMSAWNVSDLDKMALPPCHVMCQFYVANGELSCQMYQRSADMGLGVPFNIASYALLTKMIAHICGLKCGDFVHVLGDAHVYLNHVEPLKEQLKRTPRDFPQLKISSRTDLKEIDDFKPEDFEIVGYKPHKTIKMEMAV